VELNDYQDTAAGSNALSGQGAVSGESNNRALNAALFGLGSETGSLLDIQKKLLTDDLDLSNGRKRAGQELGDLLWYVARVSDALGFTLEEIATANLDRVVDMWGHGTNALDTLDEIDDGGEQERFPRRMRFWFEEFDHEEGGRVLKRASIVLTEAEPNDFPGGQIKREGKAPLGYQVGAPFGQELTDNSQRDDGYRYHDAIHMTFMACLHWSATMRMLLGIKRKSNDAKDHDQDSARPVFLEEGLAAVLAALSVRRMNFEADANIDGDVLEAVNACTRDLEVAGVPGWAWRKVIVTAFKAMRDLHDHGGGYLTLDLDARTVTFEAP
jgi:hypothetical protein